MVGKRMVYTYEIKSIIGELCMTPYQDKELYDLIHPQLIQGDTITLDFSNVKICAPPFINYAVGILLKDITLETFNKLLNITNLNRS